MTIDLVHIIVLVHSGIAILMVKSVAVASDEVVPLGASRIPNREIEFFNIEWSVSTHVGNGLSHGLSCFFLLEPQAGLNEINSSFEKFLAS